MRVVNVTQEHIELGKPRTASDCPVALALVSIGGSAPCVSLDVTSCELDGKRRWYRTPALVHGFIVAFDAGRPVEPFNFELPEAAQ